MIYENWEKNVLKSLDDLKYKLDQKKETKELYNGFYVWDSKLIFQPKIMFVGINPGDGNPNNDKNIKVKPEKQMSYLEYLDGENPTYTLAKETVDVLQKSGLSIPQIKNLLNNESVKTNFHYVITKNQSDIKKCFNLIRAKEFNDFWMQSYKWTGDLIDIIKPKMIICEGKAVFDIIKDYEDYTEFEWKNDCGFFKRSDGIIVIGYSRVFSNIKNKIELVEIIKKHIN